MMRAGFGTIELRNTQFKEQRDWQSAVHGEEAVLVLVRRASNR
jgi:hypothetical protein